MKRTQIYLDDEQDDWLGVRAAESGRTKSELIREAIDRYRLGDDDKATRLERFRHAVWASFGQIPRLPSGAEYVAEVRQGDVDRMDALERRWRGQAGAEQASA